MDKDLEYVELFELYQDLLTERQREMFLFHYYYDLSLNEIAEPDGNTRQSVYSLIKKVKSKLREYEKLLKLKAKNDKLKALAEKLDKTDGQSAREILRIIGE